MDMRSLYHQKNSRERTGTPHSRKRGRRLWYRIVSGALCVVMLCTGIEGSVTAAEVAEDLFSAVEHVEETTENTPPVLDTQTDPAAPEDGDGGEFVEPIGGEAPEELPLEEGAVPEEPGAVYTLHLTHYVRFTVNGEGRNVRAEETLELTEADFEDGVCDLSRFAYDVPQLTVTEAKPLSLGSFDEAHEGGARIVYAVNSGWRIVPVGEAGKEGAVLREVFQGQLSDYEFVPANVVRMHVKYQYSNTGGLAGIDAAAPEIVEAEARLADSGEYELEFDLPEVEGFRIVLDPGPLNDYLVNPPTGNETEEELQEMLERGDFSVDIAQYTVYYYQELAKDNAAAPDYAQTHPDYGNRYSTAYNEAWNKARFHITDAYTAQAYCGDDTHDGHKVGDHGANALQSPKLKVTLTEEQLAKALENVLNITVSYRRNATWYTVNHWVPEKLSGLTDVTGRETKEKDGVTYVLLDTENLQGRVGGLTRAVAKTEGAYTLLAPLAFNQQLVKNSVSNGSVYGTVVDIYYEAAESYRVIFDTDYTYIERQQVKLGKSVDFERITTDPQRKGYTFAGWQYLNKDAMPDDNGEYGPDAYTKIGTTEKDGKDVYTLEITAELLTQKAKLQDTAGVLALHLYPIWEPEKTQITVVLWTEDLDGVNDVQAKVTGGTSQYYNEKYEDFQDKVTPTIPQLGSAGSNSNYSNVGSFTMRVDTDSSLEGASGSLRDDIQEKVTEHFKGSARDTGTDASQFYTQCGFEILHESDGNEMEYNTTTANADGKTTVYVYFNRNIYTLKFYYYGKANVNNVESDYYVARNTNGFSYSKNLAEFIRGDSLVFDYKTIHVSGKDNKYMRALKSDGAEITDPEQMPVPQTITIRAKYGADLRQVWPVAQPEEHFDKVAIDNYTKTGSMISWATTQGKYRDDAVQNAGSSHYGEPTIMGLYATMDEEIIADPQHPETIHHLVAYWTEFSISYYRYTHCFELPGLKIDPNDPGVKTVTLYGNDTNNLRNVLYLVPTDNEDIAKYGFDDLMEVAYNTEDGTITYSENGGYYAVRGYQVSGETAPRYYAVGRQIVTTSTNRIDKQNPSARAHMTRVNTAADHTTECQDNWGQTWGDAHPVGTPDAPYDLYFYYNRDRYTIKYMAANTREDLPENETELGRIVLPYGAHITEEKYAFQLYFTDTNQTIKEDGTAKYLWSYPTEDGKPLPEVPVCPDRNPDGPVEWKFKGWGLGPAGVNMLWTAKDNADPSEPQAQIDGDFYIGSDLLLYAIWERPMLTVTFHLNGGEVGRAGEDIVVSVPANSKITDVDTAEIPRPVRSGFTMQGWYESDENGTATDIPFDFDKVIIKDQHVAAVWTAASVEEYDYTVYYVTEMLREDVKPDDFTIIQINDAGEIVESGGTPYYVLEKVQRKDQPYAPGTVLNLTAKPQTGYIPRETNKTLELTDSDGAYNAVFFYDPQTTGSYTVYFVEAGTEQTDPTVVKTLPAEADQTVVTPNADAVKALTKEGYQLVNRGADGTYAAVIDYQTLTWLDTQGQSHSMSALAGEEIPEAITYLVQPIQYTITYQIADDSPAEADSALDAVTKNPTEYTVKDAFTLVNPGTVSAADGWYEFSHWSLGEDTTEPGAAGQKEYPKLTVDPGTTGHLIFVANWKKVDPAPVGGLAVSKTVAGSGAETGREFHFTVTLDAPITGQFGEMNFTDGSAQFTLKHGQRITAEGLLAGLRYTVTEEAVSGYTTTSSGANGAIQQDKTVAAAFTNTKSSKPDHDDDDDDDDDPKLNTDDHYSYIIGYKDGTVRPYGTITRGEVATIFFRLLTDKARDKYWSQTNGYSDCGPDLWCNNAISTLTNMGIIDGFQDGTFRPYGKITRAQFAKMAVGFFETTREEYGGYFSDVEPDAWYTDYVEAASRVGLVQGFEDGTFRPNANITRAQSCVIVNRALGRKPDEDHLLPERKMITWPDNNPGDWYYADMQEATNSHDYKWLAKGKDKRYMEEWTQKLEQRDWAAFEHAWSTAHSAPGGEVVK